MSFRDVPGQDRAIEFFRRAYRSGRLAHAYVLVGPEGVGKRLLARALARYVFCADRGDDACGVCRPCRLIAADRFGDLHWYRRPEGRQQLVVEVIESLLHTANLKPLEADRKVFVLEDADKLNPAGANRLLKLLEEPPPESLLLLLALDVRDFLPTILSRCHVVRLQPLAVDDLAVRLTRDTGCSPEQARFLGHFTMGSPGLAAALAVGTFFEERDRLIDMMVSMDTHGRFAVAEEMFKQAQSGTDTTQERREALVRFLDVIALFYRDVLAAALGDGETPLINEDRAADVTALAARLPAERVRRILTSVDEARRALGLNANQKLLLENLTFDVAQLQSL